MYIGVLFYGTVVVKLIMLDDRTIYFVTEIIEIGNFIKFKMEKKKLFSLLTSTVQTQWWLQFVSFGSMEVQCSNLNREGDDTRPKYLCDYIMLTRIHYLLYSTRKNQVIHFIIPSHE